jgi:hypothetical protein
MNKQAGILAERLATEHPGDLDLQLEQGLALAIHRQPDKAEVNELRKLVDELMQEENLDEISALESACLVILNLNEFMHVK